MTRTSSLRAVGHQLERRARQRQADQPDPLGHPVDHRDALRLGRAVHGGQRNALAGLGDRQGLHPLGDVVGQRRAAIAHVAQVLEERLPQGRIALHRLGQHAERDRRRAEDIGEIS
ncbi:MAG: hypothetical protein QM775_32550 [Pirellulales bacterium]